MSDSGRKLKILYFGISRGNSASRLQGLQNSGHHAEYAFVDFPLETRFRIINAVEWRLGAGPFMAAANRRYIKRALAF
ncbi:hypothetical protein JYT83_01115, partial [bacterium AH-315-F18]|nr:hypothetical protein [bacterium AH-315-F18]